MDEEFGKGCAGKVIAQLIDFNDTGAWPQPTEPG
jgi:hypothetical protein